MYYELLIIFKQKNKNKTKITNEFETEDINEWLIKNDFKIHSDIKKEITKYDCIIIIFNKTLKRKIDLQKRKIYNSVSPDNPQIKEIMNEPTKISVEKQKLIENQVIENKNYLKNLYMLKSNSSIKSNPTKINNDQVNNQKKDVEISNNNNDCKKNNNNEVNTKIEENIKTAVQEKELLENNQEQKFRGKNKNMNINNTIDNNQKNGFLVGINGPTKAVIKRMNNNNFNDNINSQKINNQNVKTKMVINNRNIMYNLNNAEYYNSSNQNNNNNNSNINNNNQNNFNNNNNINNNNIIFNNNDNNFFGNQNNFNNNQNMCNFNQNFNNNNFINNQNQNNFNQFTFNNNNNINQNFVNNQSNFQMMNNNNNFNGNNNFNENNFEMFFPQNNFNNNNFNNFNNNFNNFNINNNFNNNNNFNTFNNFNNSNQNVPFNQPNMNNNFGFNNNNIINPGQFSQPMSMNNNMIINNMNNFNNVNIPINNIQAFTFGNIELNPNNNNNLDDDTEIFDGSKELSQLFTGIELKYPHLIGIVNIGQICYMNSTIQCLSNIKELSDFLINNFSSFNSTSNILTTAYTNLLFELIINKDNKKFIDPTEFKNIIGELNPLFEGLQAADSKDLLFFLIEQLHNELNKPNQKINFFNKNFKILESDAQNENKMLQNFLQEFSCINNSIISKNFYGVLRSIMTCEECKITKYSFQTFNMQIFILKKLREDKKAQLGPYYSTLSLMDAFSFSENEDILDGENMIYCNSCQKLTKGRNKQDFYRLPKILIIVLNRGKNNADFNEKFDFPERIDFTEQKIILDQKSYMKFYLMSVITHLGESGSRGHFIAYVREGKSDNFYCYNDASVSKVKTEDALKQKISKKEEEKITPYILFYHCDE